MSKFAFSKSQANARTQTLEQAVVSFEHPEDVVREITMLWHQANLKFLTIGRYLVKAAEQFATHRRFESEVLSRLPFGRGVAHQLRAVAEAVDAGLLSEQEIPRYSTAYML